MSSHITLIIKPVSIACNLKCAYCYNSHLWEDSKSRLQLRMLTSTLKELISQVSEISKEQVSFIWHGGEPLLAGLEFYEEVDFLQKKYLQGVRYRNSLQTNGTLISQEYASFFKERNFRIGVSLDGPREIHNRYRQFSDGRGSFDVVIKGIETLKKEKVEIGVISVVTNRSIMNADDIFKFFVNIRLQRINFSACAEKRENRLSDFSISPSDYANFMVEIFDNWIEKNDPEVKIQLLESFFQGLIGGQPTICYCTNECSFYLAIDANGDLCLCGRFMGIEKFKIGNILRQNLKDILSSDRYRAIAQKTNSLKEECGGCRWLSICNGGCSYYRYMNGGLLNSPYYFCSSTKKLLRHISSVIKQFDGQLLTL